MNSVNFIFLPQLDFNTLKSRDIDINTLMKLYSNEDIPQLTNFTKYYFLKINELLNKFLFSINKQSTPVYNLNEIERSNLNDRIKDLFCVANITDEIHQHIEKYYEFFRVSENTVLVVFSDTFVKYLTETKENFLEFLLNTLCYLYDSKLESEDVLRRYLLFKNKDTSIEYLRLFFS